MLLRRLMFRRLLTVAASAVVVACDDPLALPPPFAENVTDTLVVSALEGTSIGDPSAYDVARRRLARTELSEPFDFAFDIDDQGQPTVFPAGALGLAENSGIQFSKRNFDDIDEAPTEDFLTDDPLLVGVDSVFVVRSRPVIEDCPFFIGALPRYGKFRVMEIDTSQRRLILQALVNVNCGYRGLEPGLPTK